MSLLEIVSRNIICIMSLILLLILCLSNNAFEKRRTNVFVIVIAITIVFIICDAADIYLSYFKWENAYKVRNILCFVILSICPLIPISLILITKNNFISKLKTVPLIINFVLCFINLFTGFMFYVSADNIYYRKPLFILPVLVSLFYLVGIVISYLKSFKTILRMEIVFVLSTCFMAIASLGIQIFLDVPFILTTYITIGLIFFYLFLNVQILRTDALTITLNRNMFEKELQTYHHDERGVILVFDINDLKTVNDEHGHTKGDKYIIYTANLIKNHFGGIGVVYRIGGDEFAVICKNVGSDGVLQPISKFQAALTITNYRVALGYSEFNTTVKKKTAYKEADDAMYSNKFFLKSHMKV